jgi:hypothetical protein
MHRRRPLLAIGCALFALAAMGAESCDTTDDKSLTSADEPTRQAEEEKPAPEPAPEPKTDGDSNLACSYELGDFGDSGDPAKGERFTAGGTLTNTGNTNIRVRVTYQWKLLGTAPKRLRKIYKVREGEERDVNVTVPAGDGEISAHQSAPDPACKATATILGTY